MSLLTQIIQLLTDPPGNVVYHLLTLLALQAIFAMSLSRWRQQRRDASARRLMIASGAIFLSHGLMLFMTLLWQESPLAAATYLPPLAQAVHTITAVFLVWSLLPFTDRLPRLGVAILTAILILIGVMTASFTQDWQAVVQTGQPYNSTPQATIWGLLQIGILAVGFLFVLLRRPLRASLRPYILAILLLAHLAHFWNYPEIVATDTTIAYWIRLGYLIALPLWAVLVYRRTVQLSAALAPAMAPAARRAQMEETLPAAAGIIRSLALDDVAAAAIAAVQQLLQLPFAGIALVSAEHPLQLQLLTAAAEPETSALQRWNLNGENWPALRLASERQEAVTLSPTGLGARQLHLLYMELGLTGLGAMLVQSLRSGEQLLGLLLVAQPAGQDVVEPDLQAAAAALADFIAQAIAGSLAFEAAVSRSADLPGMPQPEAADSGRLIALESERDRLLGELETAVSRARQAEGRAAEARKQALDLAEAMQEMEQLNQDQRVVELQAEIDALRESLAEAEEALALAAAGDSNLSTEWVMLTITRYSSQLEKAQAYIEQLEASLQQHHTEKENKVLTSLAQELRTPMTSIAGYTDLLLGETIGILGAKQREFLQRVKANTERMGTLLDQIIQLTAGLADNHLPAQGDADLTDVVETAVHAVITQIREKRLRLDMNIDGNLPRLPIREETLRQVLVYLLDNACRASGTNGRVAVNAHAESMAPPNGNGHSEPVHFVHITVQDSGSGIRAEDRAHVFDPHYQANNPLIPGLGDTGAALAVARTLTLAQGGRIWVDGEPGSGSTFSLLFPLAADEPAAAAAQGQNGHA